MQPTVTSILPDTGTVELAAVKVETKSRENVSEASGRLPQGHSVTIERNQPSNPLRGEPLSDSSYSHDIKSRCKYFICGPKSCCEKVVCCTSILCVGIMVYLYRINKMNLS